MPEGLVFAELHMVSGEQQEASDLVGVATSPRFSLFKRRRGQLFTMVDPSLPGAEELCRQVIQTVEDEYFRDSSRTVTASLRDALTAASERLRAENAAASPERQLRIGISCAAVRGNDVYIAQMAPASAFVLHDNAVKRSFAVAGLEVDGVDGTSPAAEALEGILEPRISFAYSPLDEGDVIVLATGANWKLIPEKYIFDAGKHIDPEMAAADLYGHYLAHAQRPTTSLLVVRVLQLPAKKRPHPVEPASQPSSSAALPEEQDPAPRARALESESQSDLRKVRDWRRGGQVPSRDTTRPAGYPPRVAPASTEPRPWTSQPEPTAEPAKHRPSWSQPRAERGRTPLYPPGPPLEPVGKPSVRLRGQRSLGRSGASPLLGWIVKLVLMLALAALFVVVARTAMDYWQSWQLGDPNELLQEAEAKRAQASAETDPSAARALLVESHQILERALRARDDEATRSLVGSVEGEIDRIDRTVRVAEARTIIDYAAVADEQWDVSQLVLDGGNLYVLDEGMDRVFQYALASNGLELQDPSRHPVLVKRGDKLDGGVVGDLLSLTWMPAGQLRTAPAMFALESGRSLVAHDPKVGLSRIEVTESQRWGNIQAINAFGGGLYLLDTKQQGVFYYPPTKNGYESQPYTIVDSKSRVDLSKGVDIALDGNLYVLASDGSIGRFTREGRPLDFDGKLPGGPVKGAKGLFANAGTRSLYVVDEAEQRIVQFSQEGELQRQFKAAGEKVSFEDIRDIFVDEAGRKVYVLAHKSLFVFDLPPVQ